MSLRITLLSSFLWRSLGVSGQRLLSFVVLVALARLLSVQEFGTAAAASMIVLLLFPITRFGVYDYLIQKVEIDAATKTAALAMGFGFGLALFLAVFVSAPVVGRMLGDDELIPALRIISIIFLFAPIGSVQEALLAKQFKFKLITSCQIAALVPSGIVGIGLAMLGMGTLAIVLQHITMVVLTSLFTWLAEPWRPSFAGSGQKVLPMLRMGISYTGGQLLSSINTNLFGLAVAAVGGTEAVGVFRVAWAGFTLCMQLTVISASTVAQPVFASLKQDAARLRTSFLNILRYLAALTFGAFAFVASVAPELVAFVFGERWRGAGEPLAIMCLFIVAGAPNYLIRSYLSAIGRPNQTTLLVVAETVLSIALLVALVPFGTNGVASVVVLRTWAALPLTIYMIRRYAGIGSRQVVLAMSVPLLAACVLSAMVYGMMAQDLPIPPAFALGLGGIVAACAYVGTIWTVNRTLIDELATLARGLLNRSR